MTLLNEWRHSFRLLSIATPIRNQHCIDRKDLEDPRVKPNQPKAILESNSGGRRSPEKVRGGVVYDVARPVLSPPPIYLAMSIQYACEQGRYRLLIGIMRDVNLQNSGRYDEV